MAEEEKELKEFLTRDEIRTMAKDIAALRGVESQKEREKISALRTEEEIQKREAISKQKEEERRKIEEEARKKTAEEARRKAEEEEKKRTLEAQKRAEEMRKRTEEEARRKAEEEKKRQAEMAEIKKREEERRLAEEMKRKAEEIKRLEAQRAAEEARKRAEEEKRKEEERRRMEETQKRITEEAKKKAEEERKRKIEEEIRMKKEEEEKRKAEEIKRRQLEEIRRREEETRKKQEEIKRKQMEEAQRRAEEERRRAEEVRRKKEEEERKIAEIKRIAEEEKKRQEEETRKKQLEETQRKAEEERKRKAEEERIEKEKRRAELESGIKSIQAELEGMWQEKKDIEKRENELSQFKYQVIKSLSLVSDRENEAEKKEREIEEREKTLTQEEEKRAVEKARWQIQEERKMIEEERWKQEEIKNKTETQLMEVNSNFHDLLLKEKSLLNRIEELRSSLKFLETGEKTEIKETAEPKKVEFKSVLPQKSSQLETEAKVTAVPKPLSKKPSSLIKVLARIVIALIILFFIGFIYWFWGVKNGAPDIKEILPLERLFQFMQPKEEQPKTEAQNANTQSQANPPPSLILINAVENLETDDWGNVPVLLSSAIQDKFATNNFVRLIFKKQGLNQYLGLTEFFNAFEISSPAGLLEKLDNDFTLFIFAGQGGNRLGLITKIKDEEGFNNLVKTWEKTMEKDTEKLFLALGKEGNAINTAFNQGSYKNVPFRFISFPKNNFGICWAVYNNNFIFNTSCESLIKIISTN